jgi:CRISP-associated protein Cas1
MLESSMDVVRSAPDVGYLLAEEGRLTKRLYAIAAEATAYGEFTRGAKGESTDRANRFLDHGNYLAYGLGATAAWVLGLPHGLAVLHGKTRRGGLVFDIADLTKDAVILPRAFTAAVDGLSEQEFREACIASLTQVEALDFMIDNTKAIALEVARLATDKSV